MPSLARRAGNSDQIRSNVADGASFHDAISTLVRAHPTQIPEVSSRRQNPTQGLGTDAERPPVALCSGAVSRKELRFEATSGSPSQGSEAMSKPSCPVGGERCFDLSVACPVQASARGPARMPVAGASQQNLDGQVFWLSASDGSRAAFPPCGSGLIAQEPDRLQRRPRDGFSPSSLFSPALSDETGAPVENRD
jgi:hypothetical protein